jgi:hypothetical protein
MTSPSLAETTTTAQNMYLNICALVAKYICRPKQ